MDGILISNLDEIVKNPEVTSVLQKPDRWGIMSYETGEFSEKGLFAADIGHPDDAILQPNFPAGIRFTLPRHALCGDLLWR